MNDSIFSPRFDLTPVISSNLEDIETRRWLIDNRLQISNYEAWIRRDTQVKRASGTTRIEGVGLNEAEVRRLGKADSARKLTVNEQANISALQAYEFIDFLSDQPDIPIDELAIREMNRIFMRGTPETLTPGMYRRGQNNVGNFTPPDQGDVPGLMRSFALWLRADDGEAHPIIKAGIAHIHLVAVHPFWDGNGRTGRGLSTLLLQRSEFGFHKILSLEWYLSEIQDAYFRAIEQTLGNRFSSGYDTTPWLEFFTSTLREHVNRLVGILVELDRSSEELSRALEPLGISSRQAQAVLNAKLAGYITRSDYVEITGVSPITASRDLAKLAQMGLLAPEGKTRNRIYRPIQARDES